MEDSINKLNDRFERQWCDHIDLLHKDMDRPWITMSGTNCLENRWKSPMSFTKCNLATMFGISRASWKGMAYMFPASVTFGMCYELMAIKGGLCKLPMLEASSH
jgi:hypothetical protein